MSTQVMKSFVQKYSSWTQKLSFALVDQILFSASGFILNVLLARWMIPNDYGAFVVAYSWFLLFQNFYDAIIIQPMSVYGPGKYANTFRSYAGNIFRIHFVLSAIIVIILGVIVYFLRETIDPLILSSTLGIMIAIPFLLLRWVGQRPFYVISKPKWAAFGSFVFLVVLIPLIMVANHYGLLSAFSIFVIMSLTAVISSIIPIYVLRPKIRPDKAPMNEIFKDHWSYGKWSTPSTLLTWLGINAPYIIIPTMMGLSGSAALRATNNLIMPMILANTAMQAVVTPTFVRTLKGGGKELLTKRMWQITGVVAIMTLAFAVVLVLTGEPILHLVYDGQYDSYITLPFLITMSLIPFIVTVNTVIDAVLRACGGVRYTFIAKIFPTGLTVVLILLLGGDYGLVGVNISALIPGVLILFTQLWFYYFSIPDDVTVAE